jgi:ribosomal protein L14
MLKIGSYAYCIDITGVHLVKIFKVLGAGSKNNIMLGTMVMIVVKSVNTRSHFLKDERIKFKFRRGTIHRAIVVHTKEKYRRANRTYIWFPRNAVVLINKNRIPIAKRVKLGVPKEVADEYAAIGSMCPHIY